MAGIQLMMMGVGGSPPPSVTANGVLGSRIGAGSATTDTPNTTPSDGTPPYTYSWARLAGSTVPVISSATAQNPTWTGTLAPADTQTADWRVTLTDAIGRTATADIIVNLTNI